MVIGIAIVLALMGILLFITGVILGISIQKQAETYANQNQQRTLEGDQHGNQ